MISFGPKNRAQPQPDLVALRRDFHQHPELGFHEERTRAKFAQHLRALGLEVHEGVGVVGVLKAGNGNRAIGLRADMDALPIHEASPRDYVSRHPGVMHACGHEVLSDQFELVSARTVKLSLMPRQVDAIQ